MVFITDVGDRLGLKSISYSLTKERQGIFETKIPIKNKK